MAKYAAFLRGINVGGKNVIKMESLRKTFESAGFKNVKTYIQSGNVLFDSSSSKTDSLEKKIENKLSEVYKSEIKVFVRTVDELDALIKINPFKKFTSNDDVKYYVCFLETEPEQDIKLPISNMKEGWNLFKIENRIAFVISYPLKNGRYGFPTIFIEKIIKTKSSARYWKVICELVDLSKQ